MNQTWKVSPNSKFIGEYCPETRAEYKKRVWHANYEIFMNIKDTVRPCNIEIEKLLKWANIVFFVYSVDNQKSFRFDKASWIASWIPFLGQSKEP